MQGFRGRDGEAAALSGGPKFSAGHRYCIHHLSKNIYMPLSSLKCKHAKG
jgi:hypothetical protein